MVQKLGKVKGPGLGPVGWVLLLGAVGVVGVMLFTGAGVGFLSFVQADQAPVKGLYERISEHARRDAQVIAALGEPITAGRRGIRDLHDDERIVRLEIPLSGPNGTALLTVEAGKSVGAWELRRLHVKVDDTGEVIQLDPPIWMQSE